MNAPIPREVFLSERRKGIGGSDVAVLLGLSPYKTEYELWLEKTGRSLDEPSPEALERMYWGTVLEDAVARRYAEQTGRKIQRVNDPIVEVDGGIVRGNIDRAIVNPAISGTVRLRDGRLTTDRILEVKTANAFAERGGEWGEPGSEEVPQHYWLQVITYLGLTRCPEADLAVLFGGQKLAIYTIQAREETYREIVGVANEWWARHIVADVAPEPKNEAEARVKWAREREGSSIEASTELYEAIAALKETNEQIRRMEKAAAVLRDSILPEIGEAEAVVYGGKKLATWKANKDSSKTDWASAFEAIRGLVAAMAASDDAPSEIARETAAELLPYFEKARATATKTVPGARVLRIA